jgi:hypothetical protein
MEQSAHVRFGSKADMTLLIFDVRFTPESGHSEPPPECPLWAKRRHLLGQQHRCQPKFANRLFLSSRLQNQGRNRVGLRY